MSTNGSRSGEEKSSRSLKSALSKARLVQAERNDAVADLRAAEKARLDMLADEVAPVFNEIPNGYDFEGVVSAGTRPRLWVDMLSFVAMAEDKRTYRFMKDTRLGRELIFESEDMSQVADQITEYLAHRVIERDRALDELDSKREKITSDKKSLKNKTPVAAKKPKKRDEFGDLIEDEAPEDDVLEEDVLLEEEVSEEETSAETHHEERRGYSFGALFLSFLLGAGACFGLLAAAGLGYLNF